MKKLLAAALVLGSFSLSAQTLFYYGKDSVSVNDFLKAYQKNNTGPRSEKAFKEYLDLYTASRLKIAEAKALGIDTLPQLAADLENLRAQILPTYLNDKESINRMVEEAFSRSQKDLHLAHIFISTKQGSDADIKAAKQKAVDVLADLKKGTAFSAVAKEFSDDPAAVNNGGDLGWITVFSLPYELENLAYGTPVGKISAVYQSKAGLHIFKNLGERKAIGRVKAAEILLAFPPDASAETNAGVKKLADSLYERIGKGDDFGKLAAAFSNDVVSAANNGQVPEFGVGDYDPSFETIVFGLKDGAISKPFLTTHGYHIVKRISLTPPSSVNDKAALEALRAKVEGSDRMATAKEAFVKKMMSRIRITEPGYALPAIWTYSDSALNAQKPAQPLVVHNTSTLFKVGTKNISAADWISYAQSFRYKSDGSGVKPYPALWKEFTNAMAMDYYQSHLEEFNPEFRQQINEFMDGNLFFEIMQQKVWGPAQTDSAALLSYYGKNKDRYNWKPSADAVIFYASDAASAKEFRTALEKSPSTWRSAVDEMGDKIAADSSRFEWSQIPNGNATLKAGAITAPLANKNDNTVSFAYILKTYSTTEPRSFADARGLVINDYQAELEKQWVAGLHKKYPVRLNGKVWDDLLKSKKW